MKILYIADSTSIHTVRWLTYFLNAGNDIYIITLGKKTANIPGVKHLKNFKKFYYNSISFVSVLTKTRKIIREIKPHILHAHFVHQYGWLAFFCNYHPFVLTAWGTDILSLPYASRSRIGKKLTKIALRKADLMTATSEYSKSEMIKLGAIEDKVHVIHWGVDSNKFKPDIATTKIRKQLGISNQQVILSNRNHIALYNNDIVIEAMSLVKKKFPDTILILQNAGGSLENDLKRLAQEKGIDNSTIFLPQFPYDNMPALYALADVYVSVPSWDGGPVSLTEAMACGCAPIISAVPGPMEWVKDGENGRVVPIRDVNKLVDAICELLEDKGRRDIFNQKNRELIVEKADHTASMKRMELLYKGIINQST